MMPSSIRWGARSDAQIKVYSCCPQRHSSPAQTAAVVEVAVLAELALDAVVVAAAGVPVTSGAAPAGQAAVGATAPAESQALG